MQRLHVSSSIVCLAYHTVLHPPIKAFNGIEGWQEVVMAWHASEVLNDGCLMDFISISVGVGEEPVLCVLMLCEETWEDGFMLHALPAMP